MPNYENLKYALQKVNPNELLDVKAIIECMDNFKGENIGDDKKIDEFILNLNK